MAQCFFQIHGAIFFFLHTSSEIKDTKTEQLKLLKWHEDTALALQE